MVQEFYDRNIFVYMMLSLCVCGVLLKLVLDVVYSRLVKASDNMGTSKNKLTQTMKKKFETCYKLKIGVNNVDIFVDKYVYRHKFCGILLSTWENLSGQILMFCLLVGSISAVLGLIYECGKQEILGTFSVGILSSGLLIFLEGMMNFSGKKELIRLNMKDYLENFFRVRLEQELLHPELIEQYKKELLTQEEGQIVLNNATLVAVTKQEKVGKHGTKNSKVNKKAIKKEKRSMKMEQKAEARKEKEDKIRNAKSEKDREKVEKRLLALKKQEDMERKKVEIRELEEKMKIETKLAIEQKREKERSEIELRKMEAREKEEQRQDEKRKQEEIKKAMLLEKQVAKEEKQKQSKEHKTIAQERKENLKREVQERRSMESQEIEKSISDISELEIEKSVGELSDLEIGKDAVTQGTLEAEITRKDVEVDLSTEKPRESQKLQKKPISSKKLKLSDPSEEKLIEDILKEFLA